MPETTKTTPLPWAADHLTINTEADVPHLLRKVAAVSISGRSSAEAQANARLIVRAVNAMPALLAALKDARQFIANGIEFGYIARPEPGSTESKTLPSIEAAIRAAEEKPQ